MSGPEGGIRERLVFDNLYGLVVYTLDQMGWLTSSTERKDVTVIPEPLDWETELKPNLVSVAEEHRRGTEVELGSSLAEVRTTVYVDILAEDASLGRHIQGDLEASLAGRLPSIGRTGPVLDVYDIRAATPTKLFTCGLEDIESDRVSLAEGLQARRPFQRFLYTTRVVVVDAQDGQP